MAAGRGTVAKGSVLSGMVDVSPAVDVADVEVGVQKA
jgi:hypothetical protein